ncbi:periplasmic protein [Maioricimonas rarisocia]|uniref:Periplasmic protein n=1 Tax=Maioricimonas rarisocia TaxID=2528026 RepID=A0A517Z7V0_9PLAN|nr:BON domain-containing protein [Maioricimonas rarisocia]QDU38544.1 periplasmic protein [Maioricimonas rarisocia]
MRTQQMQTREETDPRDGWTRRLAAGLLALAPLVTYSSTAVAETDRDAQATTSRPSDEDIAAAVGRRLAGSFGENGGGLSAHADEGVVTLEGTASNLAIARRAVDLAETVRGVRAVVSQVSVSPESSADDATVVRNIRRAWLFDPATELLKLEASVNAGVARLTGSVGSHAEKHLAEEVVASIDGVVDIDNQIEVAYDERRTDREIHEELIGRLRSSVWIDPERVSVEVNDGDVTLKGEVESAAARRRAYHLAWIAGVQNVNHDQLEVAGTRRDDAQRPGRHPFPPDEAVERSLQAALQQDPRVDTSSVKVSVRNGTATLRGTVPTLQNKRAATRDARNTRGVWVVRNRLRVAPNARANDEDVGAQVNEALARDPFVNADFVRAAVIGGVAHLQGRVENEFDRRQAEKVTGSVRGVVEVLNELVVDTSWQDVDDSSMAQRLHDELWWSPHIYSKTIDLKVIDGAVVLDGKVESEFERRQVLRTIEDFGVRKIEDRLSVDRAP